jgi:hypothetical protein
MAIRKRRKKGQTKIYKTIKHKTKDRDNSCIWLRNIVHINLSYVTCNKYSISKVSVITVSCLIHCHPLLWKQLSTDNIMAIRKRRKKGQTKIYKTIKHKTKDRVTRTTRVRCSCSVDVFIFLTPLACFFFHPTLFLFMGSVLHSPSIYSFWLPLWYLQILPPEKGKYLYQSMYIANIPN